MVTAKEHRGKGIGSILVRELSSYMINKGKTPLLYCYEDEYFDVVIANGMLYHVPDLEKALSEVNRVLKKGGVFVTFENIRMSTEESDDIALATTVLEDTHVLASPEIFVTLSTVTSIS